MASEIPVKNCARCGGDHEKVTFQKFNFPPPDCTHWGMCPGTGEPILMLITVTDGDEEGGEEGKEKQGEPK